MSRPPKPLPSVEYLHECFNYDPDNGYLYWKERPVSHFSTERGYKRTNSQCKGNRALCCVNQTTNYLYGKLSIDGKPELFAAHRVIYKMQTGEEPNEIDHINCNKQDNRIENLRHATREQNSSNTKNTKNRVNNLPKNIHYAAKRLRDGKRPLCVQFQVDGKHCSIGTFETLEEAVLARDEFGKKVRGEFYRGE